MQLRSSRIEPSDLRSVVLPPAPRTGFQPTSDKRRHANIDRVAEVEHRASGRYVYRASHRLRVNRVELAVEYAGSLGHRDIRQIISEAPCKLDGVKFIIAIRDFGSEVRNQDWAHGVKVGFVI